MRENGGEIDNEGDATKEVPTETLSERVHTAKSKEVRAEHVSPLVKPYKPLVPYAQRLVKTKEEHKYGKFLEMLKKFHINIPFLEAIIGIPSYAKFLKDCSPTKRNCLRMLQCLSLRSAMLLFRTSSLLSFWIHEVFPSLVQLGILLSVGRYVTLGLV